MIALLHSTPNHALKRAPDVCCVYSVDIPVLPMSNLGNKLDKHNAALYF